MFCSNCGKEIDDKAYVCPNCGVKVSKQVENDNGGFLWGLLGFLCPFPFDIIIYFVLKSSMPNRMKSFSKGMITHYVMVAVLYLLIFLMALGTY